VSERGKACPDSIAIILRNVLTFRCGHGRNHLDYNRFKTSSRQWPVSAFPLPRSNSVRRTPSRPHLKVDKAHSIHHRKFGEPPTA